MTVTRNSIIIVPENDQDKAFIEDTLKLEHENEYIKLFRRAPMGLPLAIAYLEATFEGGEK